MTNEESSNNAKDFIGMERFETSVMIWITPTERLRVNLEQEHV
jgi:hypothetical protein